VKQNKINRKRGSELSDKNMKHISRYRNSKRLKQMVRDKGNQGGKEVGNMPMFGNCFYG
jgi:hypothetical protein